LLVSILFIICVNVKCIKLSYIHIFCYIILNALMIMWFLIISNNFLSDSYHDGGWHVIHWHWYVKALTWHFCGMTWHGVTMAWLYEIRTLHYWMGMWCQFLETLHCSMGMSHVNVHNLSQLIKKRTHKYYFRNKATIIKDWSKH